MAYGLFQGGFHLFVPHFLLFCGKLPHNCSQSIDSLLQKQGKSDIIDDNWRFLRHVPERFHNLGGKRKGDQV